MDTAPKPEAAAATNRKDAALVFVDLASAESFLGRFSQRRALKELSGAVARGLAHARVDAGDVRMERTANGVRLAFFQGAYPAFQTALYVSKRLVQRQLLARTGLHLGPLSQDETLGDGAPPGSTAHECQRVMGRAQLAQILCSSPFRSALLKVDATAQEVLAGPYDAPGKSGSDIKLWNVLGEGSGIRRQPLEVTGPHRVVLASGASGMQLVAAGAAALTVAVALTWLLLPGAPRASSADLIIQARKARLEARIPEAAELYEQALAADPRLVHVHGVLADLYLSIKRPCQAKPHLQKALEGKLDDPELAPKVELLRSDVMARCP